MKKKILVALMAVSVLLSSPSGFAAESGDASVELKALVTKIQTKLKEGKTTETDLAPEIKEFDTLLAKHKAEKTDAVAQILLMKANLYFQVFNDTKKGAELINQLKSDFPDSKTVTQIKRQEEGKKIQASLLVGTQFPDFTEKDLDGKPLSIANHKGKVVLIDFWATWCGPCVRELPDVLKTYAKYNGHGFEIIGISLDDNRQKLESFLKQKNMTWPQYFDGQGWENKLAQKYGVQSIPATYLLDGDGNIIAKDLRGEALEGAVSKALAKK